MTVWHWVRHGPTHERNFVGWRDVPADLSDTAQITRLHDFLPAKARMVSSDLIRAATTADAISAPARARLAHDADLREINFGIWDGMHFTDVAERDPQLSRDYWEKPGDIQAPGGESWNMTSARVHAAVCRINAAHPNADIIAVAHFGVILTQLQRALGISAYETLGQKIDNLSVTQIYWDQGLARAGLINHTP